MNLLKHSGVKKPAYLLKFQGNFHGKKGAFMHHILKIFSNPNFQFHHPPAT